MSKPGRLSSAARAIFLGLGLLARREWLCSARFSHHDLRDPLFLEVAIRNSGFRIVGLLNP